MKTICSGDDLEVSLKVKAVHDPADPVIGNVNDPSCTEAGSHDEVVYCSGCGAELSRTTVEDAAYGHDFGEWSETKPASCTEAGEETRTCTRCDEKETRTVEALGHSWSPWVVAKEPTETEDGEEVRVCERCKEIETRVIPHLVIEYRNTEGDGSTFEKGSQDALRFVFSRSIEDEKTFAHFTGVQVDGQDLDAADYTAEAGSVIVHLKPGYLEKLPVGKHKVTALFDDGNDPSAEFIIKERQQAAAPEDKKPSEQTSAKTSGGSAAAKPKEQAITAGTAKSPKTGDDNDLMLWFVILGGSLFAIFKSAGYRRRTRR
ncbi:MAG: hypothetical protein J6D46_07490 [Lachnospiraceae bacterium]|nr:hypothetical protein [Lachnospiraceae bacterium]